MEILDFIWRSIPMLLQLYADLYQKNDVEKTMIELEAEHNVPITKTYDFIVGKFKSIRYHLKWKMLVVMFYPLRIEIEFEPLLLYSWWWISRMYRSFKTIGNI